MVRKVLVVGAGPTGLTLANELNRHGVQCRIVDAADGPCSQSRALGIHARTLEYLEMMGVVEKFLQSGNRCDSVKMYADGKQVISLDLQELDSQYPFALLIPQSKTEALLEEALQRYGCAVERNVSCTKLQQSAEAVTATLSLQDGHEETESYDWVVGCDGAHSAVRHALNATFEGSAYPETFLIADVALSGTPLNQNTIQLFTCASGMLAIFPFNEIRARIIADSLDMSNASGGTGPSAAAKPSEPTLLEMQNIVDERGPKGVVLSDPHWLTAFRIHRRQVNSYKHGRVFLAGDAAHIHSPAGGQGMNTGIQDAINLAWKLALVIKDLSPHTILDSYHVERHAVGQKVLQMTDFMTKVNTVRSHVAQEIRNRLAPLLASQEVIQQRLRNEVSELAVNYHKSPIVGEHKVSVTRAKTVGQSKGENPELGEWFDFSRGPKPGDRAPDAHMVCAGRQARFFEFLRQPQHHALLFAGARESTSGNTNLVEIANYITDRHQSEVKAHLVCSNANSFTTTWSGSTFIDSDLAMHHRYGAESECLYLIRPDGYVAFRSLPADKLALDDYLAKIFL